MWGESLTIPNQNIAFYFGTFDCNACQRGVIGPRINLGPCTLRFRREQQLKATPLVEICDQSYIFSWKFRKKSIKNGGCWGTSLF